VQRGREQLAQGRSELGPTGATGAFTEISTR